MFFFAMLQKTLCRTELLSHLTAHLSRVCPCSFARRDPSGDGQIVELLVLLVDEWISFSQHVTSCTTWFAVHTGLQTSELHALLERARQDYGLR